MSNNNAKQYILRSTIDTIECYGLSHLTTRLIAETIRVNNAALHYCFGTKENLIDAALKQIAQQMLEDSEEILGREASLGIRIRAMGDYIIDGVIKFPNIIRAHVTGPLYYEDRQAKLSNMLDNWVALALIALRPRFKQSELNRKRTS